MEVSDSLLVTTQVKNVASGMGTYARLLLDGLVARGHSFTIATWGNEIVADRYPTAEWIDVGEKPRFDPTPGSFVMFGRRLADKLDGRRFELVHFLEAREGYAWVGSKKPRGTRVVGTVHDDYPAHVPATPLGLIGRCSDPWTRWVYYHAVGFLERRAYRHFDLLLANSIATARSMSDQYCLDPAMLRVAPLTIARDTEPCEAEALDGRPAILFAGGNFYRKGLDTLLQSIAGLSVRLPGARLHVAGHDRASARLESLAVELGIRDRVSFHGQVPPERVRRMMQGADMLVMVSRREALGLVYLEAFQARTPVVAGDVGGCAELVTDEVSGLLVAPEHPAELADAIHRIANDTDLRERLVRGGLDVLASRTRERLVEETLSAYGIEESAPTGSSLASSRSPVAQSS